MVGLEIKKQNIVRRFGTDPTICYYYYLWNAINYIGEENVRKSFESMEILGDEVIVGDYSSNDGTKELAEEYGFDVITVPKTEGILFHESKIANAVIHKCKSNFLVDIDVHTVFPTNMNEICRKWIKNNDITKKMLVIRGVMETPEGDLRPAYSNASYCLTYRPYLVKARGYDERTYYGYGTSHYAIFLLQNVYGLEFDSQQHNNIIHMYHTDRKKQYLKENHGIDCQRAGHNSSVRFGRGLARRLMRNFDGNVKKVVNSYW